MSLTFTVAAEKAQRAKADIVVLPMTTWRDLAETFPAPEAREIKREAKQRDFFGRWGTAVVLPVKKGWQADYVALVALGSNEPGWRRAEGLRRGLATVMQKARRDALASVAIALTGFKDADQLARAAVEGAYMANYRFTEYSEKLRKRQARFGLKKVLVLTDQQQLEAVQGAVAEAKLVMPGVELARDLVNQPAEHMSPSRLAEEAQRLAHEADNISVKIFNREQARRENFNAFLAVARGSSEEPYVIQLSYSPSDSDSNTKKIWLVGKGITFDSGGLSIKPADSMETMKIDMAGAANVLGVFAILQALKPNVEIHGLIAACENMPSGDAYRPGDIVTAMNGTTIEVLNTDAEGRITLADSLVYAAHNKPDVIIDMATLTGACVVALGESIAGLFSNDQALGDQVLAGAQRAGEGMVQLPMPEEYRANLDSAVADLRNIATTRYGGASMAALFLQEFVADIPWVHIDLAGPSFAERPQLSYWAKGATGFGVRSIVEYLKSISPQ
ncbi:leucyl aminopeptidase [Patescibacteria group bacterium]|nr:leucyl aminopeptidase [Patescibacteria group bacterium]